MRILGPIMLGFALLLGMFAGAYCHSSKKKRMRREMDGHPEESRRIRRIEISNLKKKRPERQKTNPEYYEVDEKKKLKRPLRRPPPRRTHQKQRAWTTLVVTNKRNNSQGRGKTRPEKLENL